jgi:sarcosine oxidase gamma subunit
VWDWTHQAWTSVAYQDNGTTAIPDAGIDHSSGAVRLKISGANATFMTSGISLTGSIQ